MLSAGVAYAGGEGPGRTERYDLGMRFQPDLVVLEDDGSYTYEPAPLPERPTTAPPGSAAKLQILEERAARYETLFHPQDNGMPEATAAILRRLHTLLRWPAR